jgi:hypothetical protein
MAGESGPMADFALGEARRGSAANALRQATVLDSSPRRPATPRQGRAALPAGSVESQPWPASPSGYAAVHAAAPSMSARHGRRGKRSTRHHTRRKHAGSAKHGWHDYNATRNAASKPAPSGRPCLRVGRRKAPGQMRPSAGVLPKPVDGRRALRQGRPKAVVGGRNLTRSGRPHRLA